MKKIVIALLLLALLGIAFVFAGYHYLNQPVGDGGKSYDFRIKGGVGPISVINRLYSKDLIRSRTFVRLYLKLTGQETAIKKGFYSLNNGMTTEKIVQVITSGRSKLVQVTIPEGYNNRQIGKLLAEKGFFASQQEFLRIASADKFLQEYNIPADSLEGYLFPDSYRIPPGYGKHQFVKLMLDTFMAQVDQIANFPSDPQERHRVVILASIVEKEAKLPKERSVIAGVFHNRLQESMPLESCATVQYLFDKPKKRLLYRHLRKESPYNTYLQSGLPPGPIANPGLPSLKAAANPAENDYLYFLLKGDGEHKFSKTWQEHEKAKRKYIHNK